MKSLHSFKVGDKVKVYGFTMANPWKQHYKPICADGALAIVREFQSDHSWITVEFEGTAGLNYLASRSDVSANQLVHFSQCNPVDFNA